jgi:hypothetical protein
MNKASLNYHKLVAIDKVKEQGYKLDDITSSGMEAKEIQRGVTEIRLNAMCSPVAYHVNARSLRPNSRQSLDIIIASSTHLSFILSIIQIFSQRIVSIIFSNV